LRIHNVLQFKQEAFLKNYIEKLCVLRQNAPSKYENMLFKSLSNILCGKLFERKDKLRDLRVVIDEDEMAKLVIKGNFIDRHILDFGDFSFCLVELAKRVVVQDRPLIVGSQVLAFAKIHMIKFYYDVLVKKLPPISVILVDTDSIAFRCQTDDVYKEIEKVKEHFDFSNLPLEHPLYSTANSKKFLFFKDECAGKRIKAFCTPRTKCYSILYDDDTSTNKDKGVQRAFVQKKMRFSDYKDCVLKRKIMMANFNTIVSFGHNLFTVNKTKVALEPTDYKRHALPNHIDTLAYGHYRILEN
jgi:hypothetical protein